MRGNLSCSQQIRVALEFATQNKDEERKAVIFVICCHNFVAPAGIRMNNEAYTGYPSEAEFMLIEGCKVTVLGVEHDFLIENQLECFKSFKGVPFTVIHLYH